MSAAAFSILYIILCSLFVYQLYQSTTVYRVCPWVKCRGIRPLLEGPPALLYRMFVIGVRIAKAKQKCFYFRLWGQSDAQGPERELVDNLGSGWNVG